MYKYKIESKTAFSKWRSKARGLTEHFTEDELADLFAKTPFCVRCGAIEKLTVDHIQALAGGGSNLISNIQILCKSCNSSKSGPKPPPRPRPAKVPLVIQIPRDVRIAAEKAAEAWHMRLSGYILEAIRDRLRKRNLRL